MHSVNSILFLLIYLIIKFLFDEVQNFAVGNHCSQLIIDALNWKFIPNRRDEINTKFETRPRKYNMGLLAIGGIDNHAAAANTMASSSSPSTPAVAVKGAAAAIDGAGGLTAVERYSYITNEWTQMQCNLELPVGCAIVELNGELIILGGCQQKNRSISNVCFYSIQHVIIFEREYNMLLFFFGYLVSFPKSTQ